MKITSTNQEVVKGKNRKLTQRSESLTANATNQNRIFCSCSSPPRPFQFLQATKKIQTASYQSIAIICSLIRGGKRITRSQADIFKEIILADCTDLSRTTQCDLLNYTSQHVLSNWWELHMTCTNTGRDPKVLQRFYEHGSCQDSSRGLGFNTTQEKDKSSETIWITHHPWVQSIRT